jgi:NADH-quinone oxidoreductase subunit F
MTSITSGDGTVIRIAGTAPGDVFSRLVADGDDVVAVGSTGIVGAEPLVLVTRDGETTFYTRCSPERADEIVSNADSGGVVGDPDAVVEHDPQTDRLPIPQLPGLETDERHVLGGCGWRRPTNPDDHEAAGGFADPDPASVLRAAGNLRGRGWGDLCHDEFLAETWETVRDADDAVVVVNGHGTAADSLLLESAPFEVLDGARAAATAVGADSCFVYASADDPDAVQAVQEAIEQYPDGGVAFDVVTSPAEYRAGEPTMALEAIEGNHRLEARLRPPGPERVGLHGRPTVLHTPRTLAHLAASLRDEAADTRLVTVTGDVDATATVELPETATLDDAMGAVDVAGEFKAACVGGQFGGMTDDGDVTIDPESLLSADLGTEGTVEVLTEDRCVVEFVGQRTQFGADENCGRCVPCREGTTQLASLLRDVYDGTYAPDDIEELVGVMTTSSICAFGVQAGRPARTAITAFESEFEAHADGRCPAGQCLEPLEVS